MIYISKALPSLLPLTLLHEDRDQVACILTAHTQPTTCLGEEHRCLPYIVLHPSPRVIRPSHLHRTLVARHANGGSASRRWEGEKTLRLTPRLIRMALVIGRSWLRRHHVQILLASRSRNRCLSGLRKRSHRPLACHLRPGELLPPAPSTRQLQQGVAQPRKPDGIRLCPCRRRLQDHHRRTPAHRARRGLLVTQASPSSRLPPEGRLQAVSPL